MEALRHYLNSLSKDGQADFAARCGTTISYLRKAISVGQKIGVELVVAIQRESGGAVRVEDLRPDVDWRGFRRTLTNG